MSVSSDNIILADLDVPGVVAFCTLRRGGVSQPPFDDWNLGDHVGDDPSAVVTNRALLQTLMPGATAPQWLTQVHGTRVVKLPHDAAQALDEPASIEADAAWTGEPGVPCVVMTADCLPVVFAARDGSAVGVAHAGWRGLAAGVLENTIEAMGVPAPELRVWLGPAIGPRAFEVGRDVVDRFVETLGDEATECFVAALTDGKYLANLYQLARIRLERAGVQSVVGGLHCTFNGSNQFFSYRRDGVTGRMATVVMIRGNRV